MKGDLGVEHQELGGGHQMTEEGSREFLRHEASFPDLLTQIMVLPLGSRAPHSQASLSTRQMAVSYITATTTAVATAVGLNMLTKVCSGPPWA